MGRPKSKSRPKRLKAQNRRQSTHSGRPTPLEGLRSRFDRQAQDLAARHDRFSKLLARAIDVQHVGQQMVQKSGISTAELAELRALAPQANEELASELSTATDRLRSLLASGDPLYIAAMVALTNLFGGWGTYYEPTHEGSEPKVELIVGLLATQDASKVSAAPTDGQMQDIYDELDHIIGLLVPLNASMLRGEDVDLEALRYAGALSWMILRGSSFAHHGKDLARAVYEPYDEWMRSTYGFTVADVIAVGEAAESLMTDRLNALLENANTFARSILDEVRSPNTKGQVPRKLRRRLMGRKGEQAVRGRALIEIVQPGLRDALTFSEEELLAAFPLDPARVSAVLKELSTPVGSLEGKHYTGLFDRSPLIGRPYLAFQGRYLLASPGMVLRDPVALLEQRLLEGKASFPAIRAKVLDQLAVSYLGAILPGAVTHTNLHYEQTELDGLVLFEDLAMVIEGKASDLSIPARRGDLVRLRNEIKDSVGEAWIQGARARNYILADHDAVFEDDRGNEVVRIPSGSVREVHIINPTLHELGGHAPQLARLRTLGLFPEDELPWSVFINDLRVISETCGNAAVFLHYLTWRGRLPLGEKVVVSDEIDLWGSYLFGQRFGMLADGARVIVGNSTVDFDAYYDGLVGRGPEVEPPHKFLSEPVAAFVEQMARNRPAGWRQATGVCLDLSIPELAFISARADEVGAEAERRQAKVAQRMGRVELIGIPSDQGAPDVLEQAGNHDDDGPTLLVYCSRSAAGTAAIVWAKYGKQVTFELSDFEKAAQEAVDRHNRPGR